MPLSESDLEEFRIEAIRLFSSLADDIALQLQDGDRLTVEVEELNCKDGTLPASKAAIAALPEVKITAADEEGGLGECAICLTEYVDGEEVKEMPCKHRYHSDCIGKWLVIHGSCPFCRYEMAADNNEEDEEIMVVHIIIHRAGQNNSDNEAPDNDDDNEEEEEEDSLDSEGMNVDYDESSMEDVD